MRKQQIQTQEQLTAYNRKTTHDIFFMTMEWLEKYIEVAGYYSDWRNRKQINGNNVKRLDIIGNPKKAEEGFLTQLFLFWGTLKRNLPFSDELKVEFYQWLNSVKIDNNNCPKRLKHLLYGFNEVLEGRGEKLQEDIENMKEELDSNSPEYMEQMSKIFVNIQAPMREEAEVEKSLKGKTYKDIEIGKKFGGDSGLGEKTFGQLIEEVSNNDFKFFPQKTRNPNYNPLTDDPSEEFLSSSSAAGSFINPQQPTNSQITQDVKNNPQNWRLDEFPTETSYFGIEKKWEWLLVHQNARENEYDNGKLNFNNNPLYRWENFNSQQRFEIKQALKISGDYSTQDEIKWVIKEFESNPRVWRVGKFKGKESLIHNSAQGDKSEIGTLIHSRQNFDNSEWAKINETLARILVLNEIKKNIGEFEFQTLLAFTGQYWDNINKKWVKYGKEKQETMLVHKSVKITEDNYNEHGYLLIQKDKMFQENRFNREEWAEIQSALKVDDIKRNTTLERNLVVFNQETGEYYEADDWFIHNSLERKTDNIGCLIYAPNGMIRAKDLTEVEKTELGLARNEVQTQVQSSSHRGSRGGGSGWELGGTYNLYIAGSVSIISLIGLAFIK